MRHRAHHLADRAHAYAFAFQFLEELVVAHAGAADVEVQDVGLRLGRVQLDAVDLREAASEQLRVRMIFRESIDVMLERIDTSGGDDARLPHRAAEDVLESPRSLDE